MKISTKFALTFIAIQLTVLAGLWLMFQRVIIPWQVDEMRRRAHNAALYVQQVAEQLSPEQSQKLLETLAEREPDISYLLLVDPQGKAWAHSNPARVGKVFADPGTLSAAQSGLTVEQIYYRDPQDEASPYHNERVLDILLPLHSPQGQVVGAANVGLSLRRVDAVRHRYYLLMTGLSVLLAIALLGASYRLSRDLIRPVKQLALAAKAIQSGRFNIHLSTGFAGELGDLVQNFRAMAKTIESLLEERLQRERELQEFINHLSTLDAKLDSQGRILLINDFSAKLVNTEPQSLVGKYFWDAGSPILSSQSYLAIQQAFEKALQGQSGRLETTHLLRDGRSITLDISFRVVRDAQQKVLYVVAEGLDVTERKLAEEALRKSEMRYRVLAEAANDPIYILSPQGRIAYANSSASRLFQRPPEKLLSCPVSELLEESQALLLAEHCAQVLQSQSPQRFEQRLSEEQWFDTQLVPLLDETSQATAVLGISRDISERKRYQAQLVLADRMVSIGTLAAGVAHEINNPLTYVLANLTLARQRLDRLETAPPELLQQLQQLLRDAHEGADRVRIIVRDLKTFSRADEERKGPIDVRHILEFSLHVAWNEIRHRARLVTQLDPVPSVIANEARLGQVFSNLLMNAAQAIAEGNAEQNEIRVVSREGPEGQVIVEVSDSGSGISPEHLDYLFDPFFTTKPVGEGTGLGLFVCKNIINSMGGRIYVQSQLGSGTTFQVHLPAASASTPLLPASSLPPAARQSPRPIRVLVIDDEEHVCQLIKRTLAEHQVHIVRQARKALEQLRAGQRFDLVLCDLMMPDMTGMDLFEELSGFAPEQAKRVVFMTGGAFTARARSFWDQVPNDKLEKPFPISALQSLVHKYPPFSP